jgi:DnaK suppressor protein
MDEKHFEEKLLEKQQQLEFSLSSLEEETRLAGQTEVGDAIDASNDEEINSQGVSEEEIVSGTLRLVNDALQRIQKGTYGKCLACGKQIEESRLEALPWAEYCIADQEKRDKAQGVTAAQST